MITVTCLDDGKSYGFAVKTPYEAMQKMKYTLDLKQKDDSAIINKTESGLHLWMDHSGKTYAVRNGAAV